MTEISRRDFIKQAAIGSVSAASITLLKDYHFVQAATTNEQAKDITRPALQPSKGHIVVNSAICAGCATCYVACSLYKEGVVSLALSRTQVIRDELGGYVCEPAPCLQCDGPECLYACPTGALRVNDKTGARIIEPNACNGCQQCIKACPATPPRIRYNPEKKICIKCDLCDGDPQCVKFCPLGAIKYERVS